MLDDLSYIHERDQQDALGAVEKQWQQLDDVFTLPENAQFEGVDHIIVAGMGGSALAAMIVQSWPALKIPLTIVRNYDLPAYVGPKTLVIASSYSGTTEETLEALKQAAAQQAQIAVIASGAALAEIAKDQGYPVLILPHYPQPRYAVLSSLKALLTILARANAIDGDAAFAELEQSKTFLQAQTALWRADVPTAKNPAKQLAQELIGKSVVVYSGPKLYPAAYKWKISFNENAKQVAWVNQLPEFSHNEFIGWSKQPVDKPYAVIDLRSSLEHERVQKRFEVTARMLSGMRPEPHVITVEGNTLLEQLLWASAFGDFVSIYTALLNDLNPAPVLLVESFKKELNK